MGELYDDRRQEPRFNAAGIYRLADGAASSRIFDLSLNGAMFERNEAIVMEAGARVVIVLSIGDEPEFSADVLVQHVTPERIGVEFYDMSPEDFATLTRLIERFTRANASLASRN